MTALGSGALNRHVAVESTEHEIAGNVLTLLLFWSLSQIRAGNRLLTLG